MSRSLLDDLHDLLVKDAMLRGQSLNMIPGVPAMQSVTARALLPTNLLHERDVTCTDGPSYTLRLYGHARTAEYEKDGPGGRVMQSPSFYEIHRVTVSFVPGGEVDVELPEDELAKLIAEIDDA